MEINICEQASECIEKKTNNVELEIEKQRIEVDKKGGSNEKRGD